MKPISKTEFVVLMALMTSIIPLAIDAMLPAFPAIGAAYEIQSQNEIQYIVAVLFLGFGFGQLIFGPLSDIFGRKSPIYWGLAVFIAGSVLSGFAQSFEVFLLGRFLQGFGGAAPRVISLALIRDKFSGDAMAQITSMVMTIFILVPAVAPSLGQGILLFAGWRAIFVSLFVWGTIGWIWFAFRQPETLPRELRKNFTAPQGIHGLKETLKQKTTVCCLFMSGLVFGVLIGYIGAVQDIFSSIFGIVDEFPLYFALLACSIGGSSFFNSRFVMALGMRKLVSLALLSMLVLSLLFSSYLLSVPGHPPIWLFVAYLFCTFFSVGFLFGNLNAMAMEPLGHVAGIGSAFLGFGQSTVATVVGVSLGQFFHGSVTPLALSFGGISVVCMVLLYVEKSGTAKRAFR